jgi:CheY-like chemotaxis protein/HAMP domain-containing protein
VKQTFRAKLMLIVGSALIAFALVLVGGRLINADSARALHDVEARLIPKLSLGQKVEADFERLRQEMQNAVVAEDLGALEETTAIRGNLLGSLGEPGVLEPAQQETLENAIQRYDTTARAVSKRMIEGETGEKLVEDIGGMQKQQREVSKLIKDTVSLNQGELASAFLTVKNADERAERFRTGIGVAGLAFMLGFSLWVSGRMVRSVQRLSRGIARFGRGKFDRPIRVKGSDELADVAISANEMAHSLERLRSVREQSDWLKAGQAGLSEELRGQLDPLALSERALAYLVKRTDATLGAFHVMNERGMLLLAAHHALSIEAGVPREIRVGEGLVGAAALRDELEILNQVPESYFRIRSSLGEMNPARVVLVPLFHAGRVEGVVELAFMTSENDGSLELLRTTRPMLASAVASARATTATQKLLQRTQEQAQRLAAQEEELRVSNQELHAQQEELRRVNCELESQRATLSEQNAELDGARRRLQQKAEELTRTSSYKSQFLANMSHELRTPLNSMLLLSHLLADNDEGTLTPKQVQHCKTIHSAGEDLLSLINQVLDLAKIEAGRQDVDVSAVPIERFVAHTRRVFEPMATEKGLQLRVEVEDGLPDVIHTDAQRVERVLTNLVGNAIKFTERGEVALRIQRPDPKLSLTRTDLALDRAIAFAVSDTGIGIAPEAQERVFAPFEQIEQRTDRRYAGTGLGLAIASESVGLLGGELVLTSQPGVGSTFTCVLPIGQGEVQHHEVIDDRASIRAEEPHLLAIEDDAVLAGQLLDIIRARNFKAVIASSGAEGLRLARELQPTGIVLDVKLPDLDGWTVMDRLRRDPRTSRIPVHFVSGVDEAERGLSLGAIGYLTKPATRAELLSVVQTLTAPLSDEVARRILVVEDDVREGESIVALLSQEKMEAMHVASAAAALEALKQETFACMVLDLGLPDMDGLGLLESLNVRELPRAPAVVVHTGRALTKRETKELEAYAAAVVLKDGDSAERLVDEVRLFVRHLEAGLPKQQRLPSSAPRLPDVSLAETTILVAEDDMRTAYAVSALLRGKGAQVLLAETGVEVLELLGKHPEVRGVLMDVMMPEMDGYEAMRRLRQDRRYAELPVIALTAKAMKGERERCLEAGASDYLTKPVDGERLLATLGSWILGRGNGAGQ